MKRRSILSWALIAFMLAGVIYSALAGAFSGNAADARSEEDLVILEAVWKQLDPEEQKEVTPSFRAGTVTQIALERETTYQVEEAYLGQTVYLVTFPSKQSGLLGDIRKLVDPKTNRIIGMFYRL